MLYRTQYVEIHYEDLSGILSCVWSGYQTDEGIISAGHFILDTVQEKGITKIFNDNTQVTGPWLFSWTREIWFPEIEKSGVRKFAWIHSSETFARISAKRAAAGDTRIEIKIFTEPEVAYDWLRRD